MKILFHINFHTVWGQKLCIVGSIPELGAWETALAKEMDYSGEGNWRLSIELSPDTEVVEYRYFLRVNDQQVFEEWEKNHRIRLDKQSPLYTLYDYWQTRPANIAFYSSAFTQSLFAHPSQTYERAINSRKKLRIKISAPRVEKNQCLAITGNQDCLGHWHPDKALTLSCDTFPEWHIDLDAEAIHYPLEYKFLVLDSNTREPLYWESDENRSFHLPAQEEGETVCVSGLYFRDNLPPWRCAGTVIPVFSLRSTQSFGIGDLADLRLFIDWIKKTGQRIIQVLPVNDTTATHTWTDSYPYSAISVYALHPVYISLSWMGRLKDSRKASLFEAKQQALNSLKEVDYEAVMACKMDYCRLFFEQEGGRLPETEAFRDFFSQHEDWLIPYAAYAYFRDKYQTTDFSKWGSDAAYSKARACSLCRKENEAYPEMAFSIFLQFVLHTQFKAVSEYARQNGIVLKGDLPIGVSRNSVEVWMEPQYFKLNGQAGAPPDDFSLIGQNWGFPTYNWERMEQDHFAWWKKRFAQLSEYFDAFRIDHILGFFRIWEIPLDYTEGLCGHFNPALPLSKGEIERYGLCFDEKRFTRPHIHGDRLPELFGEWTNEVIDAYLAQSSSHHFVLKPFCDTQRKIEALFAGKTDALSVRKKNGLLRIANEVLFLPDPYQKDRFHPRISAGQSYLYREMSSTDQYAFDHLYWDFFYRRHNNFWKEQAYQRLTPLVVSTQMLVCGEDLGMIPESVSEVMNNLQILSLEIERMSKQPSREFADLGRLPYLSVCTTSTHDMSPLRSWWKEDREKTQRYYNKVLQQPGEAPAECTSDLAAHILDNHMKTPSMLTIIPLQDWLAIDEALKRKDYDTERINVPAHAAHYWRYRMHLTIEELLESDGFNEKIISLIRDNGRK
ncbi:MAG: 4-alpha-glucanotransferase [Tannerellaceae bacterium]|jgi:4-alpha-glucanotransferase|nr:4-alpha-glucanotransferase [Tannerellaceae bacterium]